MRNSRMCSWRRLCSAVVDSATLYERTGKAPTSRRISSEARGTTASLSSDGDWRGSLRAADCRSDRVPVRESIRRSARADPKPLGRHAPSENCPLNSDAAPPTHFFTMICAASEGREPAASIHVSAGDGDAGVARSVLAEPWDSTRRHSWEFLHDASQCNTRAAQNAGPPAATVKCMNPGHGTAARLVHSLRRRPVTGAANGRATAPNTATRRNLPRRTTGRSGNGPRLRVYREIGKRRSV